MQTADIYTDFNQFTKLRSDAHKDQSASLDRVAKQFESLFVQMMLKSMRDASPKSELFGSDQQRMYQDMYDKQISVQIASGKGIGLADVIKRQLGGKGISQMTAPPLPEQISRIRQQVANISKVDLSGYTSQANTSIPDADSSPGWDSPEAFVKDLWPYAQQAAAQLGVDPEVLVAQSALETGWGRNMRARDDGSNSYTLFGIKADASWKGDQVNVPTLEFRDGAMQKERASFRAYDSVGQAFDDYVQFIQSHPRYQQALEKGYDPDSYARELQQAGYATDPNYAAKIQRVRNSEPIRTQVTALKNDAVLPLNL